jgi:hypothetical protein
MLEEIGAQSASADWVLTKFEPTPKISSYLVAWANGTSPCILKIGILYPGKILRISVSLIRSFLLKRKSLHQSTYQQENPPQSLCDCWTCPSDSTVAWHYCKDPSSVREGATQFLFNVSFVEKNRIILTKLRFDLDIRYSISSFQSWVIQINQVNVDNWIRNCSWTPWSRLTSTRERWRMCALLLLLTLLAYYWHLDKYQWGLITCRVRSISIFRSAKTLRRWFPRWTQ